MKKRHKISNEVEMVFSFKARLWQYKGPAGWYFVTIPKNVSIRIRNIHSISEEGWGRLKATATIGETTWKTSIWFDSKAGSYLLPVKLGIRKKEALKLDKFISVKIQFEFDNWFKDSFLKR